MPLTFVEWQSILMQGAAGSLITSHKQLLQRPLHDRQQEQLTSPQAELQNKKTVKSKLLGIMRGASAQPKRVWTLKGATKFRVGVALT